MSEKQIEPLLSLQTLVVAIQAVDKEISALDKIYEQGQATADDDILKYDLDRAAQDLEEVYKHRIATEKISNFPKYEMLINRKTKS